jgi:hypothetical protein
MPVGAAIPVARGKVDNEVHGKIYPFALRDRKRFQEALLQDGAGFRTVATAAVVSILLAVLLHARPVITPEQVPVHGLGAWVSSSSNDVVSLHDSAAQFMVFGDI